jgi:predicted transcriptional regulator
MNVLLSIKPKYVKAILNGTKKYELRKSAFRCKEDIERVYIYATSPVKKIVGIYDRRYCRGSSEKAMGEIQRIFGY